MKWRSLWQRPDATVWIRTSLRSGLSMLTSSSVSSPESSRRIAARMGPPERCAMWSSVAGSRRRRPRLRRRRQVGASTVPRSLRRRRGPRARQPTARARRARPGRSLPRAGGDGPRSRMAPWPTRWDRRQGSARRVPVTAPSAARTTSWVEPDSRNIERDREDERIAWQTVGVDPARHDRTRDPDRTLHHAGRRSHRSRPAACRCGRDRGLRAAARSRSRRRTRRRRERSPGGPRAPARGRRSRRRLRRCR